MSEKEAHDDKKNWIIFIYNRMLNVQRNDVRKMKTTNIDVDNNIQFHETISFELEDIDVSCMFDTGFIRKESLTLLPHYHTGFEIHYSISGIYDIEVSDSDKKFKIDPNSIMIIPPNCYHNTSRSSFEIPDFKPLNIQYDSEIQKYAFRFEYIHRPDSETNSICKVLNNVLPQKTPIVIPMPQGRYLLDSIYTEFQENALGRDIVIQSELKAFFILLIRLLISQNHEYAHDDTNKQSISEFSRRELMIRFIDMNYHLPITEKTLSEAMHISPRQISRIFSEQFGASFRRTLAEIRIHNAEKLLERTDMSNEKIANRIGYNSVAAFFTAFRKIHGMTPGEYRHMSRTL